VKSSARTQGPACGKQIKMPNNENQIEPTILHAEPVLAVRDILETVLYWHDVLGFPGKWTWG